MSAPRPVRTVEGASHVTADPRRKFRPHRIDKDGDIYWLSEADGIAVATAVKPGRDYRDGALGVLVYSDAPHGMDEGLAFMRILSADEADEFGQQLIKAAADMQAADLLAKAAGR